MNRWHTSQALVVTGRTQHVRAIALYEAGGHLLDRVVDRGVELRAQSLHGLRGARRQPLRLQPRGDVRGGLAAVHPYIGGMGDALDRRVLDRRIRGQRRDCFHVPVGVQRDVVHPHREQGDRHQDAGEHDEHRRGGVPRDPHGPRAVLRPTPRRVTRAPLGDGSGLGRLVRAGHSAPGAASCRAGGGEHAAHTAGWCNGHGGGSALAWNCTAASPASSQPFRVAAAADRTAAKMLPVGWRTRRTPESRAPDRPGYRAGTHSTRFARTTVGIATGRGATHRPAGRAPDRQEAPCTGTPGRAVASYSVGPHGLPSWPGSLR